MVETISITQMPIAITQPINISEVFHCINNVLPIDQQPFSVSFDSPVRDALQLMQENNFSQVPVMAGNQVLGMFTYRSYAVKVINFNVEKVDLGDLPVREFLEQPGYVHIMEDFISALDYLDTKDVVFVGQLDNLQGIITPIDLVEYLYRISSPFIIIGEIERAIRGIIQVCVNKKQLKEIIKKTLSQNYKEDKLPMGIEDMSFNDYAQMIGYGDTWNNFECVFGDGEWQRKLTRSKLVDIRDLRNDAFHFRRELGLEDIDTLIGHRDWLKNAATAYEA